MTKAEEVCLGFRALASDPVLARRRSVRIAPLVSRTFYDAADTSPQQQQQPPHTHTQTLLPCHCPLSCLPPLNRQRATHEELDKRWDPLAPQTFNLHNHTNLSSSDTYKHTISSPDAHIPACMCPELQPAAELPYLHMSHLICAS